jgi:hypothetical protein
MSTRSANSISRTLPCRTARRSSASILDAEQLVRLPLRARAENHLFRPATCLVPQHACGLGLELAGQCCGRPVRRALRAARLELRALYRVDQRRQRLPRRLSFDRAQVAGRVVHRTLRLEEHLPVRDLAAWIAARDRGCRSRGHAPSRNRRSSAPGCRARRARWGRVGTEPPSPACV